MLKDENQIIDNDEQSMKIILNTKQMIMKCSGDHQCQIYLQIQRFLTEVTNILTKINQIERYQLKQINSKFIEQFQKLFDEIQKLKQNLHFLKEDSAKNTNLQQSLIKQEQMVQKFSRLQQKIQYMQIQMRQNRIKQQILIDQFQKNKIYNLSLNYNQNQNYNHCQRTQYDNNYFIDQIQIYEKSIQSEAKNSNKYNCGRNFQFHHNNELQLKLDLKKTNKVSTKPQFRTERLFSQDLQILNHQSTQTSSISGDLHINRLILSPKNSLNNNKTQEEHKKIENIIENKQNKQNKQQQILNFKKKKIKQCQVQTDYFFIQQSKSSNYHKNKQKNKRKIEYDEQYYETYTFSNKYVSQQFCFGWENQLFN